MTLVKRQAAQQEPPAADEQRAAARAEAAKMSPEEYARRQEEFMRKRLNDSKRLRPHVSGTPSAFFAAKSLLNRGHVILALVGTFAIGSAVYVISDSMKRAGRPVCVNCDRQREIAEEIYGHKPSKRDSTRMFP